MVGAEFASFGGQGGPSITIENLSHTIAALERISSSDNSPFDRYAAGDSTALMPEPRRGLTLFRSLKTRCFECHGLPTFTNPDCKVIGAPRLARYCQPHLWARGTSAARRGILYRSA